MTMAERIADLERWRNSADRRFELLAKELTDNTIQTKAAKASADVAASTSQRVLAILETGKMGTGLIKWLVSVGAGLAVIIGMFWHSR